MDARQLTQFLEQVLATAQAGLTYLCVVQGGTLLQNTDETTAAGFHEWNALPALSPQRVLAEQIQLLCRRAVAGELETLFD